MTRSLTTAMRFNASDRDDVYAGCINTRFSMPGRHRARPCANDGSELESFDFIPPFALGNVVGMGRDKASGALFLARSDSRHYPERSFFECGVNG